MKWDQSKLDGNAGAAAAKQMLGIKKRENSGTEEYKRHRIKKEKVKIDLNEGT